MPDTDILLTTFNAKYPHSAFGLRYLMANMGDLASRTTMIEFSINDMVLTALDEVLTHRPQIVGLGVYIWNIEQSTQFVRLLKRVRPDTIVVLGGPEVSYTATDLPIVQLADYVIAGEADLEFARLCRRLLIDQVRPEDKMMTAPLPPFAELRLPYQLYSDEDIRQRTIYVEASRGCPFTCEFCLSSLEIPVRQFDILAFLDAMQILLDRGARQFKFIDRTFNLNLRISQQILDFFWQRFQPDMFLHFEMIPDRLPASLRETIKRFPPGALQFEVGIQTFNDEVAEYISRRQDNQKVAENLQFLRDETGVHVHADLIVGLPGEDLASFGRGFDRLLAMRPQEIQVGILKRLRGTPIIRHDEAWQMVYSPIAPYEILENKLIGFVDLQRMRRFARFWDLIGNSGNFRESLPLVWGDASPFEHFLTFSDWLFERNGKTHGISLTNLVEFTFEFVTSVKGLEPSEVAPVFYRDYVRGGRKDKPACLRPFLPKESSLKSGEVAVIGRGISDSNLPQRQRRHLPPEE